MISFKESKGRFRQYAKAVALAPLILCFLAGGAEADCRVCPVEACQLGCGSLGVISHPTTMSMVAITALIALVFYEYLLMRTRYNQLNRLAKHLEEFSAEVEKAGTCENISEAEAARTGHLGKAVHRLLGRIRKKLTLLHQEHWHSQIQMKVLAAEKRHIKSVIDSIPNAILVVDAFGRLVMANLAAEKTLGFATADSIRQPIERIIKDPRVLEVLRHMCQDRLNSTGRTMDVTWNTRSANPTDVTTRHWRVRVEPVIIGKGTQADSAPTAGEPAAQPAADESNTAPEHEPPRGRGVVVILQDISGEKEVDRIRSSFVSRLLHELKNPLSSIKASVEILLDGAQISDSQRAELLDVIGSETDRIHQFTEDLLNLNRLESGLIRPNKIDLALVEVVYEVARMVKPQAQQKGIDLKVDIQEAFFPVNGDRDMLRQAVLNVVGNAVKYTPAGGHISINSYPKGDQMVVEVADSGPGIPKEDLEKIFDKFYRVERTNETVRGTGLGLALVKQVIESIHKGRITVTSEVDKGTTFHLYLPMAEARNVPVGSAAGHKDTQHVS